MDPPASDVVAIVHEIVPPVSPPVVAVGAAGLCTTLSTLAYEAKTVSFGARDMILCLSEEGSPDPDPDPELSVCESGICTVTKPFEALVVSGNIAEMTQLMKVRGEMRKPGLNVWVIILTVKASFVNTYMYTYIHPCSK